METQNISTVAGLPIITNDTQRPYWAAQATDFAISIKAATLSGEQVPDTLLNFVREIAPWVNTSNNATFINRKLEFHMGQQPGRLNMTGLPRWYARRGTPGENANFSL